mmetsp:Transcript_9263/g.26468  ORF Transcript_9263/g.26468 Transcript_9263/m.26468 type:complete len:250 (+) Transcript_9263:1121-1870(+)
MHSSRNPCCCSMMWPTCGGVTLSVASATTKMMMMLCCCSTTTEASRSTSSCCAVSSCRCAMTGHDRRPCSTLAVGAVAAAVLAMATNPTAWMMPIAIDRVLPATAWWQSLPCVPSATMMMMRRPPSAAAQTRCFWIVAAARTHRMTWTLWIPWRCWTACDSPCGKCESCGSWHPRPRRAGTMPILAAPSWPVAAKRKVPKWLLPLLLPSPAPGGSRGDSRDAPCLLNFSGKGTASGRCVLGCMNECMNA